MTRARRVNDVAAMLLRVLRHTVERGRVSSEQCANVVKVQLARPGGPLHAMPRDVRERALAAVDTLAAAMEAPTPRALYAFAKASAEVACAAERPARHPGVGVEKTSGKASELARAAVFAEAVHARDSEDLVRRAVTRAIKAKKRKGSVVPIDVAEGDPLRAVLDLPARGRVFLPRNDVRTRIAHLARGTPLGEALSTAARFSEAIVRPAIGEELWDLARPVGLSPRRETRVVVEVSSSVAAQEVSLRRRELIDRLRRVPGLEKVNDLELVVKAPATLPVIGARPRE